MCGCDEGHICEYHRKRCHLCYRVSGRYSTKPHLCKTCEKTARAWGRSELNAQRYPDPERSR